MRNIPLLRYDSIPLSEEELELCQRRVGILPEDYRQFLCQSNGGRPSNFELSFRIQNSHEKYVLTSIAIADSNSCPDVYVASIEGHARKLLVVAECESSPVLMLLDLPNRGAIFFWEYDFEKMVKIVPDKPIELTSSATILKICDSFSQFLETLEITPLDDCNYPSRFTKSVENYAMYGDSCIEETVEFFNHYTVEELEQNWPVNDPFAVSVLHYAANWTQKKTVAYLISRGVKTKEALVNCLSSFEITKLLIDTGATNEDLHALLRSAALRIASSSVPEEIEKTIKFLIEMNIRPDFEDETVRTDWERLLSQVHNKKISRFLRATIGIPT